MKYFLILTLSLLTSFSYAQNSTSKTMMTVTAKEGQVLTVYALNVPCDCKGTAAKDIVNNTINWTAGKRGGLYCMRTKTRGENKGDKYKFYLPKQK